jgi:COP9 signalosome complex subunit 7
MPSIRELEDLIIDAIYLDILRGKLDQKEEQLEVEYTMGRDLEPGKIENVLETLKDWYASSSLLFPIASTLSCLTHIAGLQRLPQSFQLSIKNFLQ